MQYPPMRDDVACRRLPTRKRIYLFFGDRFSHVAAALKNDRLPAQRACRGYLAMHRPVQKHTAAPTGLCVLVHKHHAANQSVDNQG